MSLQYEDELPEDITDAEYDAWHAQSFVPDRVGVRVGPRFVRGAQPSSPELDALRERVARLEQENEALRDQCAM